MRTYFVYSPDKLPCTISVAFGGATHLLENGNAGFFSSNAPITDIWNRLNESLKSHGRNSVLLVSLNEGAGYKFCGDQYITTFLSKHTIP